MALCLSVSDPRDGQTAGTRGAVVSKDQASAVSVRRIDKRARKENDMESLIYTGIINHVLESGSYT